MIALQPLIPFSDQKPGTSGLRRPVARFQEPHYLAAYLQAVIDAGAFPGGGIALGGDGRFFLREAVAIALRVAAGNGIERILMGKGGLFSTPALSAFVRRHKLAGGILLSASHNPGGPAGDFGIKIVTADGAPASDRLNAAIFAASRDLRAYRLWQGPDIAIDRPGRQRLGDMILDIVDPVADYAALMESLFDFDRLRDLLRGDFRFRLNAMNGVAGPYARAIFIDRLGLDRDALQRDEARPDFGGAAPDPDRLYPGSPEMEAARDCDLLAIIDGDADRCALWAAGRRLPPGDVIALMAAAAEEMPLFRGRLRGVARSLPTSRALDRVARRLTIPCYETPVGWKFFAPLLAAGRIQLCGEESSGTGSDHCLEKDGIWTALFWLSLLTAKGIKPLALLQDHWSRFGRHYALRRDFPDLAVDFADPLYESWARILDRAPPRDLGGERVLAAENFRYTDPVSGETSLDQGLRFEMADDLRLILRRSGTASAGVTFRLYLDRAVPALGPSDRDPERLLGPIADRMAAALGLVPGRPAGTLAS